MARKQCSLGRPCPVGSGRGGPMQRHSSSDRSVGYLLLSIVRSVGHHQVRPAFSRQSLEQEFSEVRQQSCVNVPPGAWYSLCKGASVKVRPALPKGEDENAG